LDAEGTSAQDVGVDHGGADVFVTEALLDGPDVGSGFEQVGGEGVAEDVGVDVAEAGRGGVALDDLPDGDAFQGAAGTGEEEPAFVAAV